MRLLTPCRRRFVRGGYVARSARRMAKNAATSMVTATNMKKPHRMALIWLLNTMVAMSCMFFAGAISVPDSIPAEKRLACARKPMLGFSWKIFCQPAVIEVMNSQAVGSIVTQA
uniref:Uncharacterized protein n=1 Tax=Dickeya chrysanthemi TaxID=556 RepID=Q47326_DICCH|nr:unknown protein [Dickeya chrysanthemi]